MENNIFTPNKQSTEFNVLLKTLPTEGNIAWEYNPFRNYRLDEDLYEYDGYYYNLAELDNKFNILIKCTIIAKIPDSKNSNEFIEYSGKENDEDSIFNNPDITYEIREWKNSSEKINSTIIQKAFRDGYNISRERLIKTISESEFRNAGWINVPNNLTDPVLREKGELVDFITDELDFNLAHPIDIVPQNSYDNSVNLIMNDGFSYPKLINSRFSPRGRNTYEIVDRKGNADTNIYDRGTQFKTDASLYKQMNTFPKLKLVSVENGGALPVGNYFFYFRLSDSDGNETDFFEESGLISIFKGSGTYSSISTGETNENSFKLVLFLLSNLDTSYSYVNVYYSRASAEADFSKAVMIRKIDLKFLIHDTGISNIVITGYEPTINLTETDINLTYSLVDCAETSASCLNRLFLGNILKPFIDYKELTDLSLRFIPEACADFYDVNITNKYVIQSGNKGYIDPMFIHDKTGYWNQELYRFGIVYIMKNGELSPVFNIRGGYSLNDEHNLFSDIELYELDKKTGEKVRKYIEYDEETYKITSDKDSNVIYENVKGVVQMERKDDTKKIHHFKFNTTPEVIAELKKHVKGFFFVRQNRIPTILALGITIGIDKHGRVPTIPVNGTDPFINLMLSELTDKTHIKSEDLNGLNYISEGFMSRYRYKFDEKSSNLWKKIGMIALTVIAIAVVVIATVFSFGAASTTAPGIAAALGAGWAAITGGGVVSVGAISLIAAGAIVATTVIYASVQEAVYAADRTINASRCKYNGWDVDIPSGFKIKELEDSRQLINDYRKRLIIKYKDDNEVAAILCPEFDVRQSYYNSIFCGNECYLQSAISQATICKREFPEDEKEKLEPYSYRAFTISFRLFYIDTYGDLDNLDKRKSIKSKIVALTDNQKTVAIDEDLYHARAGEAEEPWKLVAISNDHLKNLNEYDSINDENRKINSDYVRGIYGPYLAMEPTTEFTPAETVNIYVPGYDPSKYEQYIMVRALDYSPYKAITYRININDLDEYIINRTALINDRTSKEEYQFPIYRGDCYICKYTHRFNRNFCDPAAPYNDLIVDQDCWKNGYDPTDASKYEEINAGDVNAILLGMWVTFDVRSTINLNVLTLDSSHVDEKSMTGHSRGHYPQLPMSVDGSYKIADASVYNTGMMAHLGERYAFLAPDVPYIKLWYGTRIMYSDTLITDAFKNGYRLFWSTNYKDYPVDYGSITKIINQGGSLVCVFEHGVGIIPVKERTVTGLSTGGPVYINTDNVLPDNPLIVSDKYGSQWKDSVISTPNGIYGVDTVAKKIWVLNGNGFNIISDTFVLEFLNQHISLSERELEPIIGIRNVKTHYNAFKLDVMFTFYDDLYDFEEESWNLCYNEYLKKWITFYSWIPSYSENIYNQFFSFDRDTSKGIAKLGICNADSDFADGIVLSNNIVHINDKPEIINNVSYIRIGELNLKNRHLPTGDGVETSIEYLIVRDVWGNYNKFDIKTIENKPFLFYKGNVNDLRAYRYLKAYTYQDSEGKLKTAIISNGNGLTKIVNLLASDNDIFPSNWDRLIEQDKVTDLITDFESIPIITLNGIKYIVINNVNNDIKDSIHRSLGYYYLYSKTLLSNKPTVFYKPEGIRIEMTDVDLSPSIINFLNIRANITAEYIADDKTYGEARVNSFNNFVKMDAGYFLSTVAISHENNIELLTTDFWKHGLSGIIYTKDPIKPTYWYGKQHPFEFEFVVLDNPMLHKVFDNLLIISNKAAPESFHYEVVGECYSFAEDKKNMYIRQEATKELYLYNGSNITYDHDYHNLTEDAKKEYGNIYDKSTIMPLYYAKQDKIDTIADKYHDYNSVLASYNKNTNAENFDYLAGGEIIHYKTLDEYRICNHVKAVDIKNTDENDWTRGNMNYKEDKWQVQINPINFIQKNELIDSWNTLDRTTKLVPVEFNIFEPPKDLIKNGKLDSINIPDGWNRNYTDWGDSDYQETTIRDKYIKIRIRYSGEDLAVILAVNTLYSISYA